MSKRNGPAPQETDNKSQKRWSLKMFFCREMKDIGERYPVLQKTTDTALCNYLLRQESVFATQLLHAYRGKRVLLLTAFDSIVVEPASAFQRVFRVCPSPEHGHEAPSLLSRFDALPFDSSEFDIVMLGHALEFSANPQQVLKEAARVTNHGGHMVIFGFNPVSTHGLCATFLGRLRPDSFWRRRRLLMYRVKDWLKFLDFNHLQSANLGHGLPFSNVRYLSLMSRFHGALAKVNMPFSSTYCIVSRKDVPGMTPNRLGWKEVMLKSTIPVRRAAPSASGYSNVSYIRDHKES